MSTNKKQIGSIKNNLSKNKIINYSKDNMSTKKNNDKPINMMERGHYYFIRSINPHLNYQRALEANRFIKETKFNTRFHITTHLSLLEEDYLVKDPGPGSGFSICVCGRPY